MALVPRKGRALGVGPSGGNEWEDAMVAAMRSAMDGMFGANSTTAVLYHLGDRGISIEEAVERPKELVDALTDIFGAGAMAIEVALVDGVGEAAGVGVRGLNLSQALSKARSIH